MKDENIAEKNQSNARRMDPTIIAVIAPWINCFM